MKATSAVAGLVLSDEYQSRIPGGYSNHIVDLQGRLRAAYSGGTLDQAAKLKFLDEVAAELSVAQERRAQLAGARSEADLAARDTLNADVAVLLDDRRRLDESVFDGTTVGQIKSVVEMAMLARAIQTLPRHLGKILQWMRGRHGSMTRPEVFTGERCIEALS